MDHQPPAPGTVPPQAPRRAYEHTEHGVARPDPFHWLRELGSPEVLAHLAAERSWYDTATGHLDSLVAALRTEMQARVPTTDRSVSWRRQESSYYTVLAEGREHPQLFRDRHLPVTKDPVAERTLPDRIEGELLLDANLLDTGSGFVELGLTRLSPCEDWLAWSVDVVGDEVYTLRFRNLATGEDLEEEVPRSYYGGAWSPDSRHFFYTVHDEAYRPHQIRRHTLGTPVADDVLVLEETDQRYELSVRAPRSGGPLVLWAESRDTREVWVLDADDPTARPLSVGGRRRGVEYHAEHLRRPDGSEQLLVVTNEGAEEFRLAGAPVPSAADQDHSAWWPIRPEDPTERLERVEAFASHVVLALRRRGQRVLRLLPADGLDGSGTDLTPAHPTGTLALGHNEEYDADFVTVVDQSYVQPPVWSDVPLDLGIRTERHRQPAPGHDPAAYAAEYLSFAAPDGTDVPVTLVHHRDTPLDGTAPVLIYAYGAYEAVEEPEWDPSLPSLLDRGVVFAHAHVRGGGELGRRWWNDGHLATKQHSFTDLVASADGLAGSGPEPALVDGGRIVTRGLSAGGLLQGVVFSQRPDRWRGVVAEVPFVDVVSTMFDSSIPLTVTEWDEWGDPRVREEFDWMLAYSPYDNPPPAGGRPDLLVTGALHDPRVKVWEPAKWVAALRDTDPAWSPRCLFRCELGAGAHTGPAGRFAHLAYEAEVQAWVLERMGLTSSSPLS
ncbi:MAG: S9 family peptidase [Nocardioides sp.]